MFGGVLSVAAGLSRSTGGYAVNMFLEDFPQFTGGEGQRLVPQAILDGFIQSADASISPSRWFEKWRFACGLYTAHYATLYLQTYAPSSSSPSQAAASGAAVGILKSATLGDSAVTYDTTAAATEKWGGLNATRYGQLLATEARLVGMGGTFAI